MTIFQRLMTEKHSDEPVEFGEGEEPKYTDDGLIAKAGEIVTCESGHDICDVATDIEPFTRVRHAQFTNWRWAYEPKSGEKVTRCPQCGARFISDGFGAALHVGNEWRGARSVENNSVERAD